MVFQKGHIPWDKGLTKETDERVKRRAEKLKANLPQILFTCPVCQKTKLVLPSDSKTRKFCSQECYKKFRRKLVQFTCPVCGKVQLLLSSEAKSKKTCSYKCANQLGFKCDRHEKLVLEQIDELTKQGFRCVRLSKAIPDVIAVKGQNVKVFAVEVERYKARTEKYTDDVRKYYDDILWFIFKNGIIRKKED